MKPETVGAIWRSSPNFGARRGAAQLELVVLHYTAMSSATEALERLCSREFEVSAHYFIASDGALFQLVAESQRAWHAGRGVWRGREDINSRSIGIELDNPGDAPFAAPQMSVLERLLGDILTRWNLRPECVIAHSDSAFGRKMDPGSRFDWRRLARLGLSVWPDSDRRCDADSGRFADAAAWFGYRRLKADCSAGEFQMLLDAFRLRFAPWRQGKLRGSDVAAAENLAERFGGCVADA